MRNLGFLTGIITGYILFTDEGKEMSKKFMGRINKATNDIMSTGKEIVKEAMPETSKIIGGKENELSM